MNDKAFAATCSGLLILFACFVAQARVAPRQEPAGAGELSKEQREVFVKAAEAYARAVSGGDRAKYFQALQYAADGIKVLGAPGREGRMAPTGPGPQATAPAAARPTSPFARARVQVRDQTAVQQSIKNDPTWQQNETHLLQDDPGRIFGGVRVDPGEFPDCVAVGSPFSFCCTGTLIGPNVVVTAGHCHAGGCASRVFIGDNSNGPGRTIAVKKSIRHPDFNPATLAGDLTLLILEEDADGVTPRKIASKQDVDEAHGLRLVGFGLTEILPFGTKSKVDVAIASNSCDTPPAQSKFGCNANREIVAGGNGFDSCNGDSGGPAYVFKGSELLLAGATSRATANSINNCGDGGIYVRVDTFVDWIRQTAETNGGRLP